LNNRRLRIVGIGGTLREGSTSLRALRRALTAAKEAGADTELLDLRELNFPMYEPGRGLQESGPEVEQFVEALRGAAAVLLSTAAYHGTLAGVTKNALDFAQFMASDEEPYLQDKVVGLLVTAGGALAGTNAAGAMVHAVHALRDTVAPLTVAVPQAWKRANGDGDITDEGYGERLDKLGHLVVEMAARLRPEVEPEAQPLRASA
jgi:FMN reductase